MKDDKTGTQLHLSTSHPRMPAHTDIAHDLFCLNCQYNLRTLTAAGVCPECGLAVRFSVQRKELASIDPRWLTEINSIVRWMKRSVILVLAIAALAPVLRWFLNSDYESIFMHGCWAGLFLILFSCWRFTALTAGPVATPVDRRLRRVIRVCAIVTALGTVSLIALLHDAQSRDLALIVFLVLSPFGLAGFVGGWAFCQFCRSVAWGMSDAYSARLAGQYEIGFAIGWLIFAPAACLEALDVAENLAPAGIIIGFIPLLACGLLIFGLPINLFNQIRHIQNQARRNAGGLLKNRQRRNEPIAGTQAAR